ncbi:MAG TPA: hypothetical protein VNT20_23830 [Flavisolibacter sp.]|jgi:hypothetical protein|nr:hypothetical protein [Flavisolibacter sp.]
MQKVYLLLRSNKQTGPYSLEELLQLNLKPFDLVWVDGRSAAWQYPSEIPSLKPYVPETPHADAPFKPIATSAMEEKLSQEVNPGSFTPPQDPIPQKTEAPKRVFVSIPKTYTQANEQKTFASQASYANHQAYMPAVEEPVYEKKIEVKQEIPSYTPSSFHNKKAVGEDEVHTNYSRSLNDVEEDYTNWVYKQKTKKKASVNPKDLVLATLILAVIGGGYYVMSKPSVTNSVLPSKGTASQSVATPIENSAAEAVPKEILSPEQRINTGANDASNANNRVSTNSNVTKQAKTIRTKNPLIVSNGQTRQSVPYSQTSMLVEKTNPNIHNNNDVVLNEPEVKQQPRETVPEKKKEKFGDMIKSIFSKKDRKDETKNEQVVVDDTKPANNRQATKRDADDNSPNNTTTPPNEANTANLAEQIDLTSNAPDSWMMGVKNLKITLRNRSHVTIQTASVLVSYYNENNDLLEKKLVYFNNVAPKSKAVASAPDSKFADHVDYKLASASAKEDRYAKY